jgi:hypothetical protein
MSVSVDVSSQHAKNDTCPVALPEQYSRFGMQLIGWWSLRICHGGVHGSHNPLERVIGKFDRLLADDPRASPGLPWGGGVVSTAGMSSATLVYT